MNCTVGDFLRIEEVPGCAVFSLIELTSSLKLCDDPDTFVLGLTIDGKDSSDLTSVVCIIETPFQPPTFCTVCTFFINKVLMCLIYPPSSLGGIQQYINNSCIFTEAASTSAIAVGITGNCPVDTLIVQQLLQEKLCA